MTTAWDIIRQQTPTSSLGYWYNAVDYALYGYLPFGISPELAHQADEEIYDVGNAGFSADFGRAFGTVLDNINTAVVQPFVSSTLGGSITIIAIIALFIFLNIKGVF